MFYVGSLPVFLSFFGVVVLSYWENWDPVLLGLKKLIQCIIRKRLLLRLVTSLGGEILGLGFYG